MERRIRSFAERKAAPTLDALPARCSQGDATTLDAFLDRITINVSELYRNPEQYETLRTKVLPELPAAGQRQDLERRLLVRRRGVHARLPALETLPGASAPRSSAPTSTAASWPAPSAAASPRDMAACRRRPRCSATSRRRPTAGRRSPSCSGHLQLPHGRPPARPVRAGLRPGPLPQRRHLLHRGDPQPRAPQHRRRAAAGRLPDGRRHRARRDPRDDRARADASLHLPEGRLMDISDYLPMFLAEGREHLQKLNLAAGADRAGPDATSRPSTRSSGRALAEGHERDDGLRRAWPR